MTARRAGASSLGASIRRDPSGRYPIWRNPPAAPIDRIEPVDPIDRIEPADPIDRIDPADPSDSSEPTDSADHADAADPIEPFDSTENRDPDDRTESVAGPADRRLATRVRRGHSVLDGRAIRVARDGSEGSDQVGRVERVRGTTRP